MDRFLLFKKKLFLLFECKFLRIENRNYIQMEAQDISLNFLRKSYNQFIKVGYDTCHECTQSTRCSAPFREVWEPKN